MLKSNSCKRAVHSYPPVSIIGLKTGNSLVLKTKRAFLEIWVKAVNAHGGFGQWNWAVAQKPGDVVDILAETGHRT